jgi:hypothetical protein
MTDMDKAIEEACCPPAADSLGVCSANSTGKMTDIDKIIDEAKSRLLPFESWERLPGESGLAKKLLTQQFKELSVLSGIWGLNGISARRLRLGSLTLESGTSVTGYGGTGLPNSAGGSGRRTMTATWKN